MSRKNELIAGVASASALLATAASAADLAAAATSHEPAAASDWSGFYAGVSAGAFFGDVPTVYIDGEDSSYYTVQGVTPGVFVGFQEQADNGLVWGAEAAYFAGTDAGQGADGDSSDLSQYGLQGTIDVKLKAGMDMGGALVYGFAGVSAQEYLYSSESYVALGANVGAGVELKMTDHISLGLEYTHRFLQGFDQNNDEPTSVANDTFALRASYSF